MNSHTQCYSLYPQIRFFNASDMNKIDFYKFNTLEFSKSDPLTFSNLIKCSHGINTFKICQFSRKETIASGFADLMPGNNYVVYAVGKNNKLSIHTLPEPPKPSDNRYAYVVFSVLFHSKNKHDYFANEKCVVSSIGQMDQSRYVAFVPGTYDFELKKTDRKTTLGKLLRCNLSAGGYYSIIATSKTCTNGLQEIAFFENKS